MDPHDIDTPPTSLLLLIQSDRNRELLADQLKDEFDIQTGTDDPFGEQEFDLCLLDPPSLNDYQDRLRETKTASEPGFLPVLLLAGQRSPDEFSEEVWEVVDEVLQRPVAKSELEVRIENLLQRRRLSIELARQKRHSDQRFEALFQSTPDPVVVVTPDGTITEANEAFTKIFGIDAAELQNRPITELDLSPPEAVERVLLRIKDDDPSSTTVEWDLDEGTPLVTELNTDIVTGFGDAAERIGIFRDITDRAEREQELKGQNDRLEEFADTVAHDLRNPLSIAKGRLKFAQETGDDEHFEAVRSAHDRMEQMIEELLSLAKQGQAVLDPDDILLEDAVERAWSHVETSSATLHGDIGDAVVITADEGRLCELLENLFRNAVEHGGDTVTVHIGCLPDGAGFYVEDNGPGIPPNKRNDVVQAGFTESKNGTGFGLSIVKQIVEGHNWQLSITESDEGGARFEISTVER